ncbi:ATP-binding protein [Collinsella sp. zg1085]|uniref:zeta toxin family protein n=1 Tax=Collinsella sp. zg1085 TaxID=2844380 RepID=UPI001C0B004F|nr:AAA family ATPase [Collinsella sp. zg1085]QWT17664.1 ATP-binding protein [Collinsella sp. zg1085]
MKPVLILLAGYPATGKTYLLQRIQARFAHIDFGLVGPDDIKEEVWDELGFSNEKEKAVLELEVWRRYYARIRFCMEHRQAILSDYPFSEKQRPTLKELVVHYGYQALTIRLVGDPERIYERSLQRDLSPTRHAGHLLHSYRPGQVLENRAQAAGLVSRELFLERCRTKGYERFCLGHLIEVDATDLAAIDYEELLRQLGAALTL